MIIRKYCIFIMVLSILFSLSACGGSDSKSTSTEAPLQEPTADSDSEKQKEGVLIKDRVETEDPAFIQHTSAEERLKISQIYTFTIDGCEYSLPCKVSQFLQNGWEVGEEYQGMRINEVGTDSLIVMKKEEGYLIMLTLGVYNETPGTNVEELRVGKVSVNDGQGVEINMNGITIGSSAKDIDDLLSGDALDTSEGKYVDGRIYKKYCFTDGNIDLMEGTYEYAEFALEPDTLELFQVVLNFYPISAE